MMQLWQWIRGRSGQAAVLSLFALSSIAGCRSSGTLSSQSYGWPTPMSWSASPLAAPYDEGVPSATPLKDSSPNLDADLGAPATSPLILVPPKDNQKETPKVELKETPKVEQPTPVGSDRSSTAVEDPPVLGRGGYEGEPRPPAPQAKVSSDPTESVPKKSTETAAAPLLPETKVGVDVPAPAQKPTAVGKINEPEAPAVEAVPEKPVAKVAEPAVEKPIETPAPKSVTTAVPDGDLEDAIPVPKVSIPMPEVPKPDTQKADAAAARNGLSPLIPVQPRKPVEKPAKVEDSKADPLGDLDPFEPEPVVPSVPAPGVKQLLDKPTNEKSVDEKPVAAKPIVEQPQVEKPVVEKVDTEKATTNKPESVEPNVEKPAVEKPVIEKPAVEEKPAANKPAEVQPVVPEVKSPDVTSRPMKTESLPQINPAPVAKTPNKTEPLPVPVEPPSQAEVAGRVTKEATVVKSPTSPAPGALSDASSSLPLRAPVRITDVAEFDQPADHLLALDDGSVLVSHRSSISRIKSDGRVESFSRPGSPRGLVAMGDHFAFCDASQRAIVKLTSNGVVSDKLAIKSDGYFLRAPKDIVADQQGGIYFTDPGYARIKNPIGQIHYIAPSGKVNVVVQKLAYPDGLALSPDGSRLYVVESQEDQVLSFDLLSPGKVSPKKVLAKLPIEKMSDEGTGTGIAVDSRGRVYVAQRDQSRIQVIDPDGRILTSYQCGTILVTDIAVVPGDRNQLLVAGNFGTENGRGKVLLLELSGR